jgi:hypothetical protein
MTISVGYTHLVFHIMIGISNDIQILMKILE